MTSFAELGLNAAIHQTLAKMGYESPTPIQREAIPPIMAGQDIVGQAATGTGKTAAFALPMIHKLAAAQPAGKQRHPRGLVLTPTRELALQVAEAIQSYGQALGIRTLAIYGGQAFEQQVRGLKRGIDIVVATPGRALDHLRQQTLKLQAVEVAVLDEADEMLDMGFIEDIEAILTSTSANRQTVMFSATMPARVEAIAKRHLKDPARVKIAKTPANKGELPAVQQSVYVVPRIHKATALTRLIEVEKPRSAIIFCRTRSEVDELVSKLGSQGQRVEPLHGGMSQAQRERVLKKLRAAEVNLVIATDVAARGLDIDHLTHVFNFDVPAAAESYVHRIGRVGRAGREGIAITLADPRDKRLLRNIEQVTGQRLTAGRLPTQADMHARRLEQLQNKLRELIEAGNNDRYLSIIENLGEEFELIDVALAAVKLAEGPGADEVADIPSPPADSEPMIRLSINAGRQAGIRPKDLVGAITGELGVSSRAIGAIRISDRVSLVEVRASLADRVITMLGNTTLKGQKVRVKKSAPQEHKARA